MEKKLAIRFDIDTVTCASSGLDYVLSIGRRENIRFTLFFNLGRSIHYRSLLYKQFKSDDPTITKLPVNEKMPLKHIGKTLLWNPHLKTHAEGITRAFEEGHEIGIHGGRNHQAWASKSMHWSDERLAKEVRWSLEHLGKILPNYKPSGFSSPEWESPKNLIAVLDKLGFEYLADIHGQGSVLGDVENPDLDTLPNIRTSLCGEPGGVGYFEHLDAKYDKTREKEVKMRDDLSKIYPGFPSVVYDHPNYVSRGGMRSFENFLDAAKQNGVMFKTIRELIGHE